MEPHCVIAMRSCYVYYKFIDELATETQENAVWKATEDEMDFYSPRRSI